MRISSMRLARSGLVRLALGVFSAALAMGAGSAAAQQAAYPSKPVTLIVPNPAGGSSDTFGRFFAEQLTQALGQPWVVENVPGAGGTLGVQKLLSRPADGYNVLLGTGSTHGANFSLYKSLPYTLDDTAPVACLYMVPFVVAIRADLPPKTLAEFVAYAKARPSELTYGWGNSASKIAGALFKTRTGTDIRDIPYKTAPQVTIDLLAGRIDMTVESAAVMLPYAESGKVRILALAYSSRLASMPDVPTLDELGYPNASIAPWAAAFVKAGTPREIVEKLNAAFGAALATPGYANMEARNKTKSFMCSPQELGRFSQSEVQKWAELAKLAGIERE